MKRFFLFVTALFMLVACEYGFLMELFGLRRPLVLATTLLGTAGCVLLFLRLFRRSVSAA